MYFPASPAKILATTSVPDDRVITLVLNRRSTLFAVVKTRSIEVWSIRPTSKLVTVERSPSSLSKYGQNVSLAWAPDGASLVVLTTSSHILNYVLQARDHPGPESTSLHPPLPIEHISTFPPSAGEGYITPYAPDPYDGRSGGYGVSGSGGSGGGEINLDSALDDIQGGQAGPAEGPVKDGFFRYSYSSVGYGVDLVLVGIARVGAGSKIRAGTLGVVQDPTATGSSRGKNGMFLLVDHPVEGNKPSGEEQGPSWQDLLWIPYPVKRENLRQDEPDMPSNSPSTTDLPAQTSTSTSISGAGTSARFGAGLLGVLSGGGSGSSRRLGGDEERPVEWVPVDEDVEVNVHVLKWTIGNQAGLPGFKEQDERIVTFEHVKSSNGWFICRTTKGRVYLCRYTRPAQGSVAKRRSDADLLGSPVVDVPDWQSTVLWPVDGLTDKEAEKAEVSCVHINMRFGLFALGFASGAVAVLSLPTLTSDGLVERELEPKSILESDSTDLPGAVTSLAWTSDGCALAVGWDKAIGIYSVAGRKNFVGTRKKQSIDEDKGESTVVTSKGGDDYLNGVSTLAWTAGSSQLVILPGNRSDVTTEIALLPVNRSNAASHHDPMTSDMPLLITDDAVEVYRGRDREPISLLDPASMPWDHIKLPSMYIAVQWPLRYAAISQDGTLLAVAGRNGLTHYSSNTGRWKLFANEDEELGFTVKGGMVWYHHVLIVAVESNQGHELRMYSRDQELSQAKCLDTQRLPHSVVTMTLQGTTLLVLTMDNTLYQYVLTTTKDALRLNIGESMSLQGLVPGAGKVRSLAWMFPIGGIGHDLLTSILVVLVGSQLILLEPKKSAHGGTRYESETLAEGVEAFYRHQSAGTDLPFGIWVVQRSRCLFIPNVLDHADCIALDCEAYPLAILGDKSLIVSSQSQLDERRQVPFRHFRHDLGAVLYLPYLLRWFLRKQDTTSAFRLAKSSERLPYFAHSLEILLRHTTEMGGLEAGFAEGVVGLLDRFSQGLDVAAAYTRKTEAEHWNNLFSLIGDPKDLFERCLTAHPPKLDTASRYLIAIRHQGRSEFDIHADATRLLLLAFEAGEVKLCEEILRFLDSVDSTEGLKKRSLATLVESTQIEPPQKESHDLI